ncbi:MAG TPA: AraC family transcriptional regulator [Aliidongia sp.]|nr:AraC family transcriptional regulator [Aliidongia sp.]
MTLCEQTANVQRWPLGHWATGAQARAARSELAIQAGKLLDDVRIALNHDLGAAIRATAHLAALLDGDSSRIPRTSPARGGLAPWQRSKVRDYIEHHLEGSIAVDDLADLVSLSTGHFCRAFKESFGKTPHAYVMSARVRRAQTLMMSTTEPLSQIALACGLSDQAHLTRLFRQMTGETPSAWRRSQTMGVDYSPEFRLSA